MPVMKAAQFSTLPFCLPMPGSSVWAWITAAPALMQATPSSMISFAETGIRGWTRRVEAPLSATPIEVFLAMTFLSGCAVLVFSAQRGVSDAIRRFSFGGAPDRPKENVRCALRCEHQLAEDSSRQQI